MMEDFLDQVVNYINNKGLKYELRDQQVLVRIPTFLDRDGLFDDFSDDIPWEVEVDPTQMPFSLEKVLYYGHGEVNTGAVEVLGLERSGVKLYLCLMPTAEYNKESLEVRWKNRIRGALERGRKDVNLFLNQYR
tara:strand:- start:86 stop:487 length:402 start_codon:yes stop_codon:yes gene_type:complete